jgi:hypothetical protein
MKTKHTPGPWTVMNSHKAGYRDIASLGDDEPQNRKYVCEITPSDTLQQDAALIAAAPELLETLMEIRHWLTSPDLSPGVIAAYQHDCDIAIARATGGQS